MPLPALREELNLYPGPLLADGQRSHTLHDPVRNLFFQIDWPTLEILSRWHLADPQAIAQAIGHDTTLDVEAADIKDVVRFLQENQLLQPGRDSAPELARRLAAKRGSLRNRLLHNYLFFRIPLARPDRWLARWQTCAGIFFSLRFLQLTVAAFFLGMVEVYRDWERFTATLVDTFSLPGLASYGVALLGVKVLHELGHAFTAKRYGCRVPTMGVAFLVLWPVAYTDTNDVWKLTRRDQRLKVAAAGVLTELAIAIWATCAWVLLPEGLLRSVAFLLATTTWVSTLVINASPFMRFDGYFFLSDLLEMPNLHARSFALARWDLRERLFALGEPVPEAFRPCKHACLVAFAWATWLYRLVLFLGIAALVYTFFIKAIGILLFVVEIAWFVLMPLRHEIAAWRQRWPSIKDSQRARFSCSLALALLALFFVPWPTKISAEALLRPAEQMIVYAPPHAQLEALPVSDGGRIQAGTPLVRMASPDLEARRKAVNARLAQLRWQASAGTFDSEQRAQWQVIQERLAVAEAEMSSLEAEAARYLPLAPYAGQIRYLDPDLKPGDWISHREPLLHLVGDSGWMVIAYVAEEDLTRIAVDDEAHFMAESREGGSLALRVASIDTDSSRTLAEPQLASFHGGSIPVRQKNGILYPERALYRVVLVPTEASSQFDGHSWRGTAAISGKWVAPGWRFLSSAIGLFWREAGF